MSKVDELYEEIEKLEKERMDYLEADDKAGARRIQKKIEKTELQMELLNLERIKKELKAYKEVCRQYPEIQTIVINKLKEQ